METAIDWPPDSEWIDTPSQEELAWEREHGAELERLAELESWTEREAELPFDLSTWPLSDLLEELETVRVLTPDQEDVIQDLEAEIQRRRAA